MIIQCNSCQKKFVVQDNAITAEGRVVQCGSCGNKWTQYPESYNKIKSKINTTNKTINLKKKTQRKKKKTSAPKFTEEYLEKKYGVKINNINENNFELTKNKNKIQNNTGLGFYGYLVFFIVLILTLFGILGLIKENLILNYPSVDIYISRTYEIIENIYFIIKNLF